MFLVLATAESFAQEVEPQTSKGNWIATGYFGNATLKGVDKFKANANIAGGFLGRDFFLNNKFSVLAGITNMHVRADFFDVAEGSVFITNNSLQVPVTFRFRDFVSEKTSFYIGAGVFGSYLYSSKFESELLDKNDEEKSLGFSFGLVGEVGIKHQFSDKLNFTIGLRTLGDQLDSYKDSKQEFELTNLYAIEVGLGFAL